MEIRVLLVDDEVRALDDLEILLLKHPGIQILEKISTPEDTFRAVSDLSPDLVFMDIQMPVMDGFEVARKLHECQLSPEIIFVTAYNEFAIQAIRMAAFDYLLKPVDPLELNVALNRYSIKEIKDKSHRYQALLDRIPPQGKIKFPTGSGFILVNPSDIIYINADWNYSEIFLTNDNREMITTNLGTIEKSLPTNYFYRVNRSTIINLTYLERVNRKKRTILLVRNGQEYIFTVPLLNIRKLERHLEEKQL